MRAAFEFRQESMLRFGVPHGGPPTSFCYAPPDTGVSGLKMGPSETSGSRKFDATSQSALLTALLEGEPRGAHRRRHTAAANLQQPLSLGFAEPVPLSGKP